MQSAAVKRRVDPDLGTAKFWVLTWLGSGGDSDAMFGASVVGEMIECLQVTVPVEFYQL